MLLRIFSPSHTAKQKTLYCRERLKVPVCVRKNVPTLCVVSECIKLRTDI